MRVTLHAFRRERSDLSAMPVCNFAAFVGNTGLGVSAAETASIEPVNRERGRNLARSNQSLVFDVNFLTSRWRSRRRYDKWLNKL